MAGSFKQSSAKEGVEIGQDMFGEEGVVVGVEGRVLTPLAQLNKVGQVLLQHTPYLHSDGGRYDDDGDDDDDDDDEGDSLYRTGTAHLTDMAVITITQNKYDNNEEEKEDTNNNNKTTTMTTITTTNNNTTNTIIIIYITIITIIITIIIISLSSI